MRSSTACCRRGHHGRDPRRHTLAPDAAVFQTVWFGYTVMVVAMTFLFVGVKRYRDVEKGGVIRFLPALGMGLAIGAGRGGRLCAIWEIYLAATHYAFIDIYFRQPGDGGNEGLVQQPAESLPSRPHRNSGRSALIMAVVSAALLRNPRLLPARR